MSVGALDILAEARLAVLLSRLNVGGRENDAMTAERVLHMATLGGATALGMNALIGSIEPDKAADLVAIDLSALACQPGDVADRRCHRVRCHSYQRERCMDFRTCRSE